MIKIFSDSTCDLSDDLLKQYDIGLLPLHVQMGREELRDHYDQTTDKLFKWSDKHDNVPMIVPCPTGEIIDLLAPHLDQGHEIIIFTSYNQLPDITNNYEEAIRELGAEDKISIIDSENLSAGMGSLVIQASVLAAQGHTGEEIEAKMEQCKRRIRTSILINDLTYLYRGGYISKFISQVGKLLEYHPKIILSKGELITSKKYRGAFDIVFRSYLSDIEKELLKANPDHLYLTHTGLSSRDLDTIYDSLAALGHFKEIHICQAGIVNSIQCGPGSIAIFTSR